MGLSLFLYESGFFILIDYLGSSILAPVGYAIGGWATGFLGPVLIFIVGGILQTGLIGLGLLHPNIRALD